ncbi:2Fe-2S iron-sulfur cluster-binding protein [Nocardia sp. NPDC003963]
MVELRRSGAEFTVPPGSTVLEALERRGFELPSLCRTGICGVCEHRALTVEPAPGAAPRGAGAGAEPVRLCVTGAGTVARLVLDL